jgi:hypothetical protein
MNPGGIRADKREEIGSIVGVLQKALAEAQRFGPHNEAAILRSCC